jgi:hypothetical protein
MFQTTPQLIFGLGVVVTMLLGIRFAISPHREGKHGLEAIFGFISFFLLLFGLQVMVPSSGEPWPIGDLLASLALTFFWCMRRRQCNSNQN